MRAYRQWVVWRFEAREAAKDTKVPYCVATRKKAAVDRPDTWCSFEEALACVQDQLDEFGQLQRNSSEPGIAGIGFVLTAYDPYGFIDLDDTHGDVEAYERQVKIYNEFDSYSEFSPSGTGLHIITKGEVPHGRKRASIEVYSSERYMTMTGNVFADKPIQDRNKLLNILWDEMGGPAVQYVFGEKQEQTLSDEDVLTTAQRAANGDKFAALYVGNWQGEYSSQSEADQALMNILAYYTQNRAQLMRLFRGSELGNRDKAQRDRYLDYTINKAFDRNLPPLDLEGLLIAFKNMVAAKPDQHVYVNNEPVTPLATFETQATGEPGGTPVALSAAADAVSDCPDGKGMSRPQGQPEASSGSPAPSSQFPPGLVGEIAAFIMDQAPRPVAEYALAGSLGLLAGITGRAYNISGTGLNQYIMAIGNTGTGKEAIASGIAKLMGSIVSQVPASVEFKGPGVLVSDVGIIKWLARTPCVFSVVGEIGKKLKEMSSPTANANLAGLSRLLLDLFNKSGFGNELNPIAYSDKDKNTITIHAPAFTLIGESTPEKFYEALDENMIAEGLLPRFTIIEYTGPRVQLNANTEFKLPPMWLAEKFATLVAQCLTIANNRTVQNVAVAPDAHRLLNEFDAWCDAEINNATGEVTRQLWNRAHVNSLKLSAVLAIGQNYIQPVVSLQDAQWAADRVAAQVNALQRKFEAGEIGNKSGNERQQFSDMLKVVAEYMTSHSDRYASYGVAPAMHQAGVVPYAYIQRRLINLSSYRLDRQGATNAVQRQLKVMLDTGALGELSRLQVQSQFGRGERAFAIQNPRIFAEKA